MAPDNVFQRLQEFISESHAEYEQVQKELKETYVLIRQTSGEVTKISRRNAQIVDKVRQVESRIDSFSS